jgi:hypothetical protein
MVGAFLANERVATTNKSCGRKPQLLPPQMDEPEAAENVRSVTGEITQHLRQHGRAGGNMFRFRPFVLDVACPVPAGNENHRGRADLGEMARIVAGGGQDGHGRQALVVRRPRDGPEAKSFDGASTSGVIVTAQGGA